MRYQCRPSLRYPWLFAILIISSCKSDIDNPADFHQGTGRCRIVSESDVEQVFGGETLRYKLVYDQYNRVSQVISRTGLSQFLYYDTYLLRMHVLANGSYVTNDYDSITLDENGRVIAACRVATYASPSVIDIQQFYYDKAGQLVKSADRNYEYFYQWRDGDIISDYDSIHSCSYNYYDVPMQYGGQQTMQQLVRYGRPLYSTKHLLKSYVRPTNDTTLHNYSFDAAGKILTDTIRGQQGMSCRVLRYECI